MHSSCFLPLTLSPPLREGRLRTRVTLFVVLFPFLADGGRGLQTGERVEYDFEQDGSKRKALRVVLLEGGGMGSHSPGLRPRERGACACRHTLSWPLATTTTFIFFTRSSRSRSLSLSLSYLANLSCLILSLFSPSFRFRPNRARACVLLFWVALFFAGSLPCYLFFLGFLFLLPRLPLSSSSSSASFSLLPLLHFSPPSPPRFLLTPWLRRLSLRCGLRWLVGVCSNTVVVRWMRCALPCARASSLLSFSLCPTLVHAVPLS